MSSLTVNKQLRLHIRERRVFEVIAVRETQISASDYPRPNERSPEEFVASCADYESANAVMRRYAELEQQRGEVVEKQRQYAETSERDARPSHQANIGSGAIMGGYAPEVAKQTRY